MRVRLARVGNDGTERERERKRDEWKGEEGVVMNGGPLSVTDAMANYSWSTLRCTAGGADTVLSGQRISLHPPFALRGEITAQCTT